MNILSLVSASLPSTSLGSPGAVAADSADVRGVDGGRRRAAAGRAGPAAGLRSGAWPGPTWYPAVARPSQPRFLPR